MSGHALGRRPAGSERRAQVAIGVDLGTSGLKAVALGEDGRVIARSRCDYPTARPGQGVAEQSPDDWDRAVDSALHELARLVDPRSWVAIGLSAMLPTLVVFDAQRRPVGAAITWEDSRAGLQGERIGSRVGKDEIYTWTGQRLDGRYLLPMADRLLSEASAAEGGSPAIIAGAKDYLFMKLTGELLTDPSTAAGYGAFNLSTGGWDRRITSAMSHPVELPQIVPSVTQRPLQGRQSEAWGCNPGLPVVVGAADSVMAAYGMGVDRPGGIGYVAGTSTAVVGFSESPVFDAKQRCLVSPMAEGGYGLEMDLLSTGSALNWMAQLFQLPGGAGELVALADGVPLSASPTVLPFLAPGEQAALWCPSLRGSIQGLTLRTTPGELARGLLTGILIESRRCIEVLDELLPSNGRPNGTILVSGTGASSMAFRRDLADATGHPVGHFPGEGDHSAIGAALLAMQSATGYRPAAPQPTTVDPDPAQVAVWSELAEEHDSLLAATAPLNHRLPD